MSAVAVASSSWSDWLIVPTSCRAVDPYVSSWTTISPSRVANRQLHSDSECG